MNTIKNIWNGFIWLWIALMAETIVCGILWLIAAMALYAWGAGGVVSAFMSVMLFGLCVMLLFVVVAIPVFFLALALGGMEKDRKKESLQDQPLPPIGPTPLEVKLAIKLLNI